MRLIAVALTTLLASYSFGFAQGNPSGRGSVKGDPAASSANPGANPRPYNRHHFFYQRQRYIHLGGKDDNMDGGRDKMPESNMAVRPSPGKPEISNPAGKQ